MPRSYKPLIPQSIGEIKDLLASMMLSSPTFTDAYFTERSVDTEFFALNEGLGVVRDKLGEERYAAAVDLSNRMRAHFEADPEDTNGEARAGRALIREMQELLKKRPAKA
jgi:hypothetical protein